MPGSHSKKDKLKKKIAKIKKADISKYQPSSNIFKNTYESGISDIGLSSPKKMKTPVRSEPQFSFMREDEEGTLTNKGKTITYGQ